MAMSRLLFITGTDTGVGKSVLTGLLLAAARNRGRRPLALKPFCSGGRADARLLRNLQENELSLDEVNPLFFQEPVSPLAAARRHGRRIQLAEVAGYIERVAQRCDELLIEGAGGLLVPVGDRWSVLDLIRRLGCETLVVARNRLGTINHTLLTVQALRMAGIRKVQVILMDTARGDASTASNAALLTELLGSTPLTVVPWLGSGCRRPAVLRVKARALRRSLERIWKR